MTKVETILSEFTSVFADVVDDKIIRHDVHKSINEIQKILNRELHGGRNDVTRKTFGDEVTKEENLKVGIEGKPDQQRKALCKLFFLAYLMKKYK